MAYRNWAVWGNENHDGPNNDPHPEKCRCWCCDLTREKPEEQINTFYDIQDVKGIQEERKAKWIGKRL